MNYLRYFGVVIALTIGLPIAFGLLGQLIGVNLSSGFLIVAPTIAAAMIEGQKFATRNMRLPTRSETVSFGAVGTLIAMGTLALFTVSILMIVPGYGLGFFSQLSAVLIVGFVLFIIVAIAISNLLFLRMGAKNQLKRLNAQDIFK